MTTVGTRRGEVEPIRWSRAGQEFRPLVLAEDSGGSFSLTEVTMPAGTGAGAHIHPRAEECFYVVAGEYRFTIGDEQVLASAGASVVVPRGTPHAFAVGDQGGRHLTVFAPAGCERAFGEIGAAMDRGDTSPEFWAELGVKTATRFLAHNQKEPPGTG